MQLFPHAVRYRSLLAREFAALLELGSCGVSQVEVLLGRDVGAHGVCCMEAGKKIDAARYEWGIMHKMQQRRPTLYSDFVHL